MKTSGKFILMNLSEFENYILSLKTQSFREINHVQMHHTWSPSYDDFDGTNHFKRLISMENEHMSRPKPFKEIGQNFTTFPDGTIAVCRNLNTAPACIAMRNTGGICIENLGNFNSGGDKMTPQHREIIIKSTALLCIKFKIAVDTNGIVYHHWFRLSDGKRDNGNGDPDLRDHKTCPGTAFFGGNKMDDAVENFLPLVANAVSVYKNKSQNGVNGSAAKSALVSATALNIRSLPDKSSDKVGQLTKGDEIKIYEVKGNWGRIGQNEWVHTSFVTIL